MSHHLSRATCPVCARVDLPTFHGRLDPHHHHQPHRATELGAAHNPAICRGTGRTVTELARWVMDQPAGGV